MAEKQDSRPVVVVVGAGLIGTMSTYWLSRSDRYNVVCIEKGAAPACATSKANAGRFCPSLLGDFAPKLSTLRSLMWGGGGEAGVGQVSWSPSVISWGLKYIQAAGLRRDEINATLNQMGTISSRLMADLLHNTISLETTSPNVWVYADEASLQNGKTTLQATAGAKFVQLDGETCSALTSISKTLFGMPSGGGGGGCLSVESDYTANARDFTVKISQACSKNAQFKYNTRVDDVIRDDKGKLSAVKLNDGTRIACDYLVVACGPWSDEFMKKWFGVSLPIMPVRGASVQLEKVTNRPKVGFSDNASGDVHFQVTPYGKDSLRLVGFADVVAPPSEEQVEIECSSRYRDALVARLNVVLPEVKWKEEGRVWCGLRPITPDRLPIIGHSGQQGVFLNVGHGAIGWTLAASSGYLLAASLLRNDGYEPLGLDSEADAYDIDTKLGLKRFRWL